MSVLLQPAWQVQRLPSNRPWIFASQDLLPRRRCSASALTKAWQWQVSKKKNVGSLETFSADLSWLHPMLWVCQQSWVAVILQRPSKTWTISCTCFITACYSLQAQHLDQCSGQDLKESKITNAATVAHEASLRKKLWTKALLPHQGHCQHQSRSTSTQPIFQAPCFHIIRSCEIAGDLKAHPSAVAPKILSKKRSQVAWLELRAVIAMGLGRFNKKTIHNGTRWDRGFEKFLRMPHSNIYSHTSDVWKWQIGQDALLLLALKKVWNSFADTITKCARGADQKLEHKHLTILDTCSLPFKEVTKSQWSRDTLFQSVQKYCHRNIVHIVMWQHHCLNQSYDVKFVKPATWETQIYNSSLTPDVLALGSPVVPEV